MQSLVDALVLALSHSINMRSSNSPPGAVAFTVALRFFCLGAPPFVVGFVAVGEFAPSSAFRFFPLTGLPARLPLGTGLVARLCGAGLLARLASGLAPRLVGPVFSFGLGLVARFARTECPPRLGLTGDVARTSEESGPAGCWLLDELAGTCD